VERRSLALAQCSLRVEGESAGRIVGYAVRYNQISDELWPGGPREKFLPGAFTSHLATKPDIRALRSHDADLILGRTAAGTLKITEDADGIAFELDPPDTQYARDLLVSIKRGDIRGMSFGFSSPSETVERHGAGRLYVVDRATLHEITFTAFPAYPQTSVELRAKRERDAAEWERTLSLPLRRLDCQERE
jgi:HK97 family phage prohead protease